MKDIESDELEKIELVREKFFQTAKLFGFKLMDPSPLELISTIEAKSGPAIRDEIYFFKDKADREVALRFDFTIGLTRYVVSQKSLKLPAKFASFGGVWRYDEPQRGRYRFFHQWNVEIYGKQSIESETEVIEFTSHLFDNLNLKNIIIDINNRTFVQSYINKTLGKSDKKVIGDILKAVDKTQKKRKDEILKEYAQKGYQKEKLTQILDFSTIKGTPDQIERKFDTKGLEGWSELKQLYASLLNNDVKNVRINFAIVRGLDYYSGMVFEAFDKTSDLGALAGGGRYDSLTKALGREDIGATGVAGGVERIILTMEEQNVVKIEKQQIVSVLYVNEEMQRHATRLASQLRQKQISADVDLLGRSLKKQMEAASESKYTIIVAPKEFQDNSVVLRNMKDGSETIIKIEKLLSDSKSILNS